MVTPSLGTLEPILPPIDHNNYLDMYSFQRIILLSNEDLLEAMVKVYENSSFLVSISLKNQTDDYEHSYFPMSIYLKNETYIPPINSSLPLDLVLKPSFHLPVFVYRISSSLSGEPIPISSQESFWV
jgi:hypothetical protein